MDLLVIGGGRFAGYDVVSQAAARGDRVTVLQRGQTSRPAPDGVTVVHGDRDGGLAVLGAGQWDAVVDMCGYVPRVVRQSAELLRERVGRYCFVSTVSVYAEEGGHGITEGGALSSLADHTVEEVTGETYGGLKVLCEQVVSEVYGDRSFVPRPGLIVGPNDFSNRFPYWVRRGAEGGQVLVPRSPEFPVQWVDARDLAAFVLRGLDDGLSGAYNCVGPLHPLGAVVETAAQVAGSSVELVPVDEQVLLDAGVQPWTELPMWLPVGDDSTFDGSRAAAAGLSYRPMEDTVAATLEWDDARGRPEMPETLSREREAELLAARS